MRKILLILSISVSIQQVNAQAFEKEDNFLQAGYGFGFGYGRLLSAYQTNTG